MVIDFFKRSSSLRGFSGAVYTWPEQVAVFDTIFLFWQWCISVTSWRISL
jgi:hypothetical protein